MKKAAINLFILLTAIFSLVFVSCNETTSPAGSNPNITQITPVQADIGDEVTITGSSFGLPEASSYVNFGTIKLTTFVSWDDSKIVCKVPVGAKTGKVSVAVGTQKSNEVAFTVIAPLAPAALRATSKDAKTVLLRWDASPSENDAKFNGYILHITGTGVGPIAPKNISKDTVQPYEVFGLDEGTVYNFELVAVSTTTAESEASKVSWSPASRFTEINANPIKVYVKASSFGSGLDLYDATAVGPRVLTIISSDEWNLGLRDDGNSLNFGSATILTYNYSGTPIKTEVSSDNWINATGLDACFDSDALNIDETKFKEQVFDLNSLSTTDGVVFVVRYKDGTNTNYNYAKVWVKKPAGGFLQGSGNDQYIEVQISYQMTPGVPYAY